MQYRSALSGHSASSRNRACAFRRSRRIGTASRTRRGAGEAAKEDDDKGSNCSQRPERKFSTATARQSHFYRCFLCATSSSIYLWVFVCRYFIVSLAVCCYFFGPLAYVLFRSRNVICVIIFRPVESYVVGNQIVRLPYERHASDVND